MKQEIPVFKRCCCCLPLRYGLLAWGYFKIIAEVFIIPIILFFLLNTLTMLGFNGETKKLGWFYLHLPILILTLTSLLTDIVATIVFIIAGHKKNVKLLRGFYFYSIAMLIVTLLLITSSACVSLFTWFSSSSLRSWYIFMMIYSALFTIFGLQIYFLLLLRSEVMKLRNNGEFKFVNNAAEAECTMTCEKQVAQQIDETETKDV